MDNSEGELIRSSDEKETVGSPDYLKDIALKLCEFIVIVIGNRNTSFSYNRKIILNDLQKIFVEWGENSK